MIIIAARIRVFIILIVLGLSGLTACSESLPQDSNSTLDVCEGLPLGRVDFAQDEAVHKDAPMEWWYWTGHLQSEDGRWFGFEQTFFRVLINDYPATMLHFAITDIADGSFHYVVEYGDEYLYQPRKGFDLQFPSGSAMGLNGHDTLYGEVDNYTLSVDLVAVKKPVLQHENGYTDYSFGGNTYYYSRERMDATATLTIDGEAMLLTGEGWFDHQWGDIGVNVNRGWDWFALQLDDNREIMLFLARDQGEDVLVGGSITDAACNTTEIKPGDFSVTALSEWTSPVSGCTYPQGWDITVAGMNLTVTPVLADQEVLSMAPNYWEGASIVTGDAKGRAYVELNGYCN